MLEVLLKHWSDSTHGAQINPQSIAGKERAKMIKVAPMPDELAIAHEGRIAWMNGWLNEAEARIYIWRDNMQMGHDLSGMNRLHRLAWISDIAPREYMKLHSMLPIIKMISNRTNEIFGEATEGLSRSLSMSTQKKGAFCCPECMNEDLKFWDFSWYRRKHHLIGIDWCSLHGCQLLNVRDENAFYRNPHHWQKLGQLKRPQISTTKFPESAIVRRYIDISEALLLQTRPFSFLQAKEILAAKIKKYNLKYKTVEEFLTEKFQNSVPDQWLKSLDPRFCITNPFFQSSKISYELATLKIAGFDLLFILALAILYKSPEEALHEIEKAKNSEAVDGLSEKVCADVGIVIN